MEGGLNFSSSRSLQKKNKPERKIIEKNRRNQMKLLYSQLYSLVPSHFMSKGVGQVWDRLDRTIEYIETLKNNLEMSKNKKEKLLSKKRSHQQIKTSNGCCKPLDVQIHEINHDLDAVLVTGLRDYSSFCDVVRLLERYSAEVTHTNFSSNGHSTFHIRHKKIEAEDVCNRVKNLGDNCSNTNEMGADSNNIMASFCNEVESDLNLWDFDLQSIFWGWELEK